ncbi:hypothetical protein [Brochothrix thermosphacta]|uniref:hypothetical protein n=1 Tax=Brochothrix thermosphacta TaxID=2756 RepID=UPI003F98D48A
MLDDIQRYFSNNVYVLLAYRHKQLFNSILDKKLGDNRELLTKGYIADGEIFEQTAKYIEKILPVTQQVFLNIENNSAEDILKNIVIDCADTEGIGSIEEFIINKIKETTNIEIKPIDQRENTQYIFPTTLRNFLKQVQFLEGLELMDESKKGKSIEKIINNIKSYYTYYYNKISSELSVDLMCIVDDWNSVNNDTKNLTLVAALINKMEKDNIVLDEDIKIIAERQAYNIMMGDVFQVMEIFKEKYRGDVVKSHFIYSLKVLYQAKLLLALHSYQLNENKEDLYDYLDLINGKIIPNNFAFSKEIISGNSEISLEFYENVNKEEKNIYGKLFYSDVSAKGKIRSEGYEKSLSLSNKSHSYKYRSMFYDREKRTDNEGTRTYVKNTSYLIDPFSGFLKERYVENTFSNVKDKLLNTTKEKDTFFRGEYLFYSLFDIELIVRNIYFRESESKPLDFAFNKINSMFKDNLLAKSIFENKMYYQEPFTFEEIELVKLIWPQIIIKPKFPTSKKVAIKVIDFIISENSEAINKKEVNELVQVRDELAKPRTQLASRIERMGKIFITNDKIKVLNEAMKVVKE